ncbi:hypothetical protein ES708_23138 [subsurface metagenome]
MSMMPSIPKLRTPERSDKISPRVAKIIGVAIRIAAPISPVIKAILNISLIIFAPALSYIQLREGKRA